MTPVACRVCGRPLRTAASRAAGAGPVCRRATTTPAAQPLWHLNRATPDHLARAAGRGRPPWQRPVATLPDIAAHAPRPTPPTERPEPGPGQTALALRPLQPSLWSL